MGKWLCFRVLVNWIHRRVLFLICVCSSQCRSSERDPRAWACIARQTHRDYVILRRATKFLLEKSKNKVSLAGNVTSISANILLSNLQVICVMQHLNVFSLSTGFRWRVTDDKIFPGNKIKHARRSDFVTWLYCVVYFELMYGTADEYFGCWNVQQIASRRKSSLTFYWKWNMEI